MSEEKGKDGLSPRDRESVATAVEINRLLRRASVSPADLEADDYDPEKQSIEEYLQEKNK